MAAGMTAATTELSARQLDSMLATLDELSDRVTLIELCADLDEADRALVLALAKRLARS